MFRLMFKAVLGLLILFVAAAPLFAQTVSRAQMEADIVTFRAKLQAKEQASGFGDTAMREQLRAKEEAFLAPDASDLPDGAKVANSADGGVIRLMPREKYQNVLRMNGWGAYYSFTRLTHEYGQGSDLELQQGKLMVGFAGANFGFIAKLGDVPLETVSLESAGVPALAHYQPPGDEPNARIEQVRLREKFVRGALTYVDRVDAEVDQTFALRSINYLRADVLVAFRVVRKDVDGSLIIAWKMLRQYPTPPLEMPAASAAQKAAKVSD